MKKFVKSIFSLLTNIIIIVGIILLYLILFVFVISKTSNIAIEDTVSYVKSFSSEISTLTLPESNNINIKLDDSSENTIVTKTYFSNNKFYYNQLDNNSKIIYDALENNIDNLKKSNYNINFSTKFNKLLNRSDGRYILNKSFQSALDAFFYDHPELFYLDLSKITLVMKYTTIANITTYTVSICPKDGYNNYLHKGFSSEADVDNAILKVEQIRNNVINKLPNTNDYSKALQVHDILVNSLEYDTTLKRTNTYNIYGALIEKKVVCEGYAKAFKYIMDSLDIDCILISGDATNSSGKTESHMWNYINLDGKWYGVDVTWDDPIIKGNGFTKNIIRHTYFAKGNNVFEESHVVNNKISDQGQTFNVPTLSDKNYK